MTDKQFLFWLADRLVFHYGESGNVDFVHKLRAIATNTQPEVETKWSGGDKASADTDQGESANLGGWRNCHGSSTENTVGTDGR